jgi:transposase-like protein
MLIVETVARIRRAHFVQGKSIKAIAREFGVVRNTLRNVLRSGETAPSYERTVQPRRKIGKCVTELERRLAEKDRKSRRERLDLIRVYEGLQADGYEGGYDAVRRYARARQRRLGTATGEAFVPLAFSPGKSVPVSYYLPYPSAQDGKIPGVDEDTLLPPPALAGQLATGTTRIDLATGIILGQAVRLTRMTFNVARGTRSTDPAAEATIGTI